MATRISSRELVRYGQLALAQPGQTAQEYDRLVREQEKAARAFEKAGAKTTHWREKLSVEDTEAALAQAQALENSVLRFINPAW